jgi:hypothetical protein
MLTVLEARKLLAEAYRAQNESFYRAVESMLRDCIADAQPGLTFELPPNISVDDFIVVYRKCLGYRVHCREHTEKKGVFVVRIDLLPLDLA